MSEKSSTFAGTFGNIESMQPIEFADILSTELQLAHTGYLTHALCLQGTATLLFNGAEFPLQAGDWPDRPSQRAGADSKRQPRFPYHNHLRNA